MSSPLGESRGGTPTGVRAPLSASRTSRVRRFESAPAGVPLPFLFVRRLVARVKRSEIRSGLKTSLPFLDFAPLHPGYWLIFVYLF
jgi:hypothetical protein